MRKLLIPCLLVLFSTGAMAETYRWIDAAGRTIISDSPPPGQARKVETAGAAGSDETALPFAVKQAMAKYPVTLYTTPDCSDACDKARALLNARGTPFTEKSLKEQAGFDELKQLVGDSFVPSLKVGEQHVRGYQEADYNKLLDIAGYPKSQAHGVAAQ